MLNMCYKKNIQSVLVEGGAQLLNTFIASGLWDEANVEVGHTAIGNGVQAPAFSDVPDIVKTYGGNKWLHYKNKHKQPVSAENIENVSNV